MTTELFAETQFKQPILCHTFGAAASRPHVLIIGGVHGDEIEGVWCAHAILRRAIDAFDLSIRLTIVPQFNFDGVLMRERKNSNGVDLNRNLPSKDWTHDVAEPRYFPGPAAASEFENRGLVRWLDKNKPDLIISLHSWKPMLNINGTFTSHNRRCVEAISRHTGYEIVETIGYPTLGCLGTYAGLERGWPTLTYEIERGLDQASVIQHHAAACWHGLTALTADAT